MDPRACVMTARTRNISHRRILTVHETQTITPTENATMVRTEAAIRASVGWGLKSRIESFALKRFGDNTRNVILNYVNTCSCVW